MCRYLFFDPYLAKHHNPQKHSYYNFDIDHYILHDQIDWFKGIYLFRNIQK